MRFHLPTANLVIFLFITIFVKTAVAKGPNNNLPSIKSSGLRDTQLAKAYIRSYENNYVVCSDSIAAGRPYLFKAYEIFVKAKNIDGICDAAYMLANDAQLSKNYSKALEYSFVSLKYAEMQNSKLKSARAYKILGLIYYTQQHWKDALEYFNKSIKLAKTFGQNKNLSIPLYLSGLCKIELNDCQGALLLLDEAQKMAIKNNDSQRIHECHWAKGRAYVFINQFEMAKVNLNQAAIYFAKEQEYNALSSIYYEFAKIDFKNQQFDRSLNYAQMAYEYDKKSPFRHFRIWITKLLYEIYNKTEKLDKALFYLEEYNDVRDSVLNKDILSEVAVAQAKYEFKKTEDRINRELLENEAKKRRSNYIVLIFGAFIILGSFAYYSVRKERKKSDELLLNILPKNTADELKKFGSAKPKQYESVTIMFCDVESFTKVSEQLSAESIVNMLNFYFGGFDRIIGEYGIEKIKTIGDAYMCAAGLDNQSGHAHKMVNVSLKFQDFLKTSADVIAKEYGLSLSFRIGVHTGSVVSGVVGSKKYAYDIWGDAVNIAARMEQTSIPSKINISESTYQIIKDDFVTTYRGEISAKNKSAMKMYFVESAD